MYGAQTYDFSNDNSQQKLQTKNQYTDDDEKPVVLDHQDEVRKYLERIGQDSADYLDDYEEQIPHEEDDLK